MVVHSISLPPGEFGTGFIDDFFLNRLRLDRHPFFSSLAGVAVSAHFVVFRDGSVHQYVSADQRAWHAGASSHQGRGNCNDYSIGVELEGLEGGVFEGAQYDALADLWRACRRRYPLTHVAGHEHVAPGRKADPGAGFDWVRFAAAAALPDAALPSQVVSKFAS
jgi:AmpD protein